MRYIKTDWYQWLAPVKLWYQWQDTHASLLVQVDWHRLLVPENWSVCMALKSAQAVIIHCSTSHRSSHQASHVCPYLPVTHITTVADRICSSNTDTSQTWPGYQVRLLQGSVGYVNMNMLMKPGGHMHKHTLHTVCNVHALMTQYNG